MVCHVTSQKSEDLNVDMLCRQLPLGFQNTSKFLAQASGKYAASLAPTTMTKQRNPTYCFERCTLTCRVHLLHARPERNYIKTY